MATCHPVGLSPDEAIRCLIREGYAASDATDIERRAHMLLRQGRGPLEACRSRAIAEHIQGAIFSMVTQGLFWAFVILAVVVFTGLLP